MNNNLNDFVIKTNGLKSNSKRGHLCGMTSTISDQFFYPHPSTPSSSKMNNKSIVQKQQNLQTRDKFEDPLTPLPCGRHKCVLPNKRN